MDPCRVQPDGALNASSSRVVNADWADIAAGSLRLNVIELHQTRHRRSGDQHLCGLSGAPDAYGHMSGTSMASPRCRAAALMVASSG